MDTVATNAVQTLRMAERVRHALIDSYNDKLREGAHGDYVRTAVRVTPLEDATEHVHPAPGSTADYDGRGQSFLVFINESTPYEREYMIVVEDITMDDTEQATP